MNKKTIFGIVIIVIIAILWYFGIFKTSELSNNQDATQVFNDAQLKIQAITNKDENLCNQMSDKDQKSGCYTEVAKVKKDKSICENISDTNLKQHCNNSVELFIANENFNEILNNARSNLDPSLCANIGPEEKITKCEAIVEHTITIHQKYGANIPECESKDSQPLRNQCYRERASHAEDPALCLDVLQGNERDLCYDSLGQLLNDPDICRLTNNKIYQDNCLFLIALENNNFTQELCDELENHELNPYKDRCFAMLNP